MNPLHDDRCPKCNSKVLGFGKINQCEVLINDGTIPTGMGGKCRCCGSYLVVALDTFDPLIKGSTLWEVVQ